MTKAEVMNSWRELCNHIFTLADATEQALLDDRDDEDLRITLNYCEKFIAVIEEE